MQDIFYIEDRIFNAIEFCYWKNNTRSAVPYAARIKNETPITCSNAFVSK